MSCKAKPVVPINVAAPVVKFTLYNASVVDAPVFAATVINATPIVLANNNVQANHVVDKQRKHDCKVISCESFKLIAFSF